MRPDPLLPPDPIPWEGALPISGRGGDASGRAAGSAQPGVLHLFLLSPRSPLHIANYNTSFTLLVIYQGWSITHLHTNKSIKMFIREIQVFKCSHLQSCQHPSADHYVRKKEKANVLNSLWNKTKKTFPLITFKMFRVPSPPPFFFSPVCFYRVLIYLLLKDT